MSSPWCTNNFLIGIFFVDSITRTYYFRNSGLYGPCVLILTYDIHILVQILVYTVSRTVKRPTIALLDVEPEPFFHIAGMCGPYSMLSVLLYVQYQCFTISIQIYHIFYWTDNLALGFLVLWTTVPHQCLWLDRAGHFEGRRSWCNNDGCSFRVWRRQFAIHIFLIFFTRGNRHRYPVDSEKIAQYTQRDYFEKEKDCLPASSALPSPGKQS